MTRMGREFSLVLLGAGVLTAGFFAAPSAEEELEQRSEEHAAQRVGHSETRHYRGMPLIFFVHSPGFSGRSYAKSPASPTVTRSGFGSVGRSISSGGAS